MQGLNLKFGAEKIYSKQRVGVFELFLQIKAST